MFSSNKSYFFTLICVIKSVNGTVEDQRCSHLHKHHLLTRLSKELHRDLELHIVQTL